MADVLMLVLRVIHVLLGAFWFGGAVITAAFLGPAVRSLGPDGGRFMQELVQRRKFGLYMTLAGDLTVFIGLALLGHNMASEVWRASTYGQVMMAGSATGILALAIGHAMNAPSARKMAALGGEIQRAGRPPTPEQVTEMARLQQRLSTGATLAAVLLTLTVVAMAAASQL